MLNFSFNLDSPLETSLKIDAINNATQVLAQIKQNATRNAIFSLEEKYSYQLTVKNNLASFAICFVVLFFSTFILTDCSRFISFITEMLRKNYQKTINTVESVEKQKAKDNFVGNKNTEVKKKVVQKSLSKVKAVNQKNEDLMIQERIKVFKKYSENY